ncbi:MAG TPA: hypothetical protein VK846_14655, partial [Candidatus Limnocylindria bacterium]|nr:hypothetical protein [Candidatus Limnocylindria bacterium]
MRDTAGLFSAATAKQADETIRTFQRDFRKDLLVETFAGVPGSRTNEYTLNREQFFADMVRERAQAARLDGIYVLIMKEPPPHHFRIQVGVGEATRQRAFVPANRDALVRLLQASFRENKHDEGLRSAVTYVEGTLRSNLSGPMTSTTGTKVAAQGTPMRPAPSAAPSSGSSVGSMVLVGAVIVGGIFLVMFLMRLIRGGTGGGGLSRGAGGLGRVGGGGGFMSSLLGGVGGALAASWLYDRFTGNAHANDHVPPIQGGASSDVGGDFTNSGGDVSDFGS